MEDLAIHCRFGIREYSTSAVSSQKKVDTHLCNTLHTCRCDTILYEKKKGRLGGGNRHGGRSSSIANKNAPPCLPFPQYPHEESNETPKDKNGDAIEWARLVCLVPNPNGQLSRGFDGKGCLSSCILLRLPGFQISDNLPQPRNWVPFEPDKNKIFSALLAPNFARRSLTTNFRAEKILSA